MPSELFRVVTDLQAKIAELDACRNAGADCTQLEEDSCELVDQLLDEAEESIGYQPEDDDDDGTPDATDED